MASASAYRAAVAHREPAPPPPQTPPQTPAQTPPQTLPAPPAPPPPQQQQQRSKKSKKGPAIDPAEAARVTDDEIAACVSVLQRLGAEKSLEVFESTKCRELRKALRPFFVHMNTKERNAEQVGAQAGRVACDPGGREGGSERAVPTLVALIILITPITPTTPINSIRTSGCSASSTRSKRW